MKIMLLILLACFMLINLSGKKLPALATVDKVDLNRYAGLWYQFAYFPNSFQPQDAQLTTAEYILNKKGYVTVINTAYKDFAGKEIKSEIKGKAFIADKVTHSKLKVQFFWPFKAPYWITLLVSDPARKYLWILSRQPTMDKALYQNLLSRIAAKDIDVSRIVITGKFE
jgi:apolipoprotein D and lipocalin family protein